MSTIMPITPIRELSVPLNLLMKVRQFFTQRVLAQKLSVTDRTISLFCETKDAVSNCTRRQSCPTNHGISFLSPSRGL